MHAIFRGRVVGRRLRKGCLERCLATEAVGSSVSSDPTTGAKPSRQWQRPIANGVIKAYDEALALIRRDSNIKVREIQRLQKELQTADASRKPEMERRLSKLEIESQVNLAEVRWLVKEGLEDMSKPVHRHLVEKAWRKNGRLDKLMERVHQMHVIPDVIPAIHPDVDLRVSFDRKNPTPSDSKWVDVDPGEFLDTTETMVQPRFQATVFHPESRLYTLLVVDPDRPDPSNSSFQTYLHLLQPNISLSASASHKSDIPLVSPHVSWVPPHPEKGTPYHRYVSLLLPQPHSSQPIEFNLSDVTHRLGFNVRDFIRRHQLGYFAADEGVKMRMVPLTYADRVGAGMAGGLHMWRAVWDQNVSRIYQDILHSPEPRYGRPPKLSPYESKVVHKYY